MVEDSAMPDLFLPYKRGTTAVANLFYPRAEVGELTVTEVHVGLVDVRAADDLRITYDFERDGYVIEQSTSPDVDEPGYREVAFVPAWHPDHKDDLDDGGA